MIEAKLNGGVVSLPAETSSRTPDPADLYANSIPDSWMQPDMNYQPSTTISDLTTTTDIIPYPIENMMSSILNDNVAKISQVDDQSQVMLPNGADSFPSLQEIQELCIAILTHSMQRIR